MWFAFSLLITKKYYENIVLALTILLITSFGALAQTDKAETYVGIQYQQADFDVKKPDFRLDSSKSTLGVNASITNYETKNIGLTAEGTANWKTGSQSIQHYSLMGGITLKSRKYQTVQPFVRGLVGVSLIKADNERFSTDSRTSTDVMYAVGAGIDVGKERVKWRLVQADYVQTKFFNQSQNTLRIGSGIIF